MDNIMDTLITDRTQADVDRAKYLNSLWDARAGRWRGMPEEWAEWAAGPRGAYGWNDMNRVNEAVSYLTGLLSDMGYSVATEGVVPAYNIRVGVEPDGGGIASGGGTFYKGDTVTVAAQASDKYDFAGWMEAGEVVSTDLVYTFTVERSRSLTAAFALKQFRVDAGVDPAGSGETTGGGVYDIDTEVTVTAVAGSGYAFTRWTENSDIVADGPEYTFTLDRDRTLVAVMTKTHVIAVAASDDDGGTAAGSGTYLDGQTVTVSAAAADGYEFAGWREAGQIVSEDDVYSFAASADRELTAVFVRVYAVTLLVEPDGGGAAQGGGRYREGKQVTVTASPDGDYRFVEWAENGERVSDSAAYTFAVTGNRTLTAVFEEIPVYTVTVEIDPAGSGTVTGEGQYREGATCTLVATVADGYKFTGWQENGQTVSTDTEYSFTVTEDRTLTVIFVVAPPSRLPAGYTEVEYIYIYNKSCYFSTGLTMNYATTVISIDIKADSYESGTEVLLNCPASPYLISVFRSAAEQIGFRQYGSHTPQYIQKNITGERIVVKYDGPNKKIAVGDLEASINTSDQVTYINILAPNTAAIHAYFYGIKVTTSGTLMADFIPCINSDGVGGYYDIVRNRFFTISGSNDFTAGPAV